VIGYYDRIEDRLLEVSLARVEFEPGDHFSVRVTQRDGSTHDVPFHRIRTVYRDRELIWERP
jgi:uncharacterized protein (UPF0248 family)